MDMSSWFRRKLLRENRQLISSSLHPKQSRGDKDAEKDEQFLGVTDTLIALLKSFTIETFKNFPPQDDEEAHPRGENNLSQWQERHALLVLSKVKEISQLRYKLCPQHLKEHQFWRIYFVLVKSIVSEYELRAIQLDKLKTLTKGNEKASNGSPYEVEMAETNAASRLASISLSTP